MTKEATTPSPANDIMQRTARRADADPERCVTRMPLDVRAYALLLMALAGPSCDFYYGVNRQAPIPAAPDVGCVERVIRAAPGVDDVRYARREGGRPLTWRGLERPTDVHAFVYRDGAVFGVLRVSVAYDGTTRFSQTLVDVNRKPPQEVVDATRPVMLWIEEQLESQCGMLGLSAAVEEECTGVECPAVDPPDAGRGPNGPR